MIESYYIKPGQLNKTFTQILKSFSFNCNFGNLKLDASRLEEQFYQQVGRLANDVFEIQVINTPFIRGKGAYIVGQIVSQIDADQPILIALLNDKENKLYVDTLLTDVTSISVVFDFSRSYFFITTNYPSAIVEFLKDLLPSKTRAVLYSSLGDRKSTRLNSVT